MPHVVCGLSHNQSKLVPSATSAQSCSILMLTVNKNGLAARQISQRAVLDILLKTGECDLAATFA